LRHTFLLLSSLAVLVGSGVKERGRAAPADAEAINKIMVAAHVRDIDGKGNRGTRRNLDTRVLSGDATDREKARLLELYRQLAQATPPKGSIGEWKWDTTPLVQAMEGIISRRPNAGEELAKALNCKACHAKYQVGFAPGLSNLTDLKYYDLLESDPVRKRSGLPLPPRRLVELAGTIKKEGGSPLIEQLDSGWSVLVDFPERTSDNRLRLLRGAPGVSMIRILKGGATDTGLGYLRNLPDLRLLVINSVDVTDEGMKAIGTLAKLRTLDVLNARVTGRGLAELVRLTELKELHLFAAKVSDDDLTPLRAMRWLKHLSLPPTVSEAATDGLRRVAPETTITHESGK
jgi:hypothetical protein